MEFLFNVNNLNNILENATDPILDDNFGLTALTTRDPELIAALDDFPLAMTLKEASWEIQRDGSGALELSFIDMVDEANPKRSLRAFTALRTDIDSLTIHLYLSNGEPVHLTEFAKLRFEQMTRKFDAAAGKAHLRLYLFSFESSIERCVAEKV